MNKLQDKRTYRTLLLTSIVSIAILSISCGKKDPVSGDNLQSGSPVTQTEPAEQEIQLTSEQIKNAKIEIGTVVRKTLSSTLELLGEIGPNQDRLVHIVPLVSGTIRTVNKGLGDSVRRGEVIATLDSQDLAEAKSNYVKSRTNVEVAEKNYARESTLYAKRLTTEQDLLSSEGQLSIALTERDAAEEKLHLFGLTETDLENIREQHGKAKATLPVVAPISGMVIEKHANLGEFVDISKDLFTVADLSSVWVQADVFEKDFPHVRIGQSCVITVNAFPNDTFLGKVSYVSAVVDEKTRTVKVRIEVNNRENKLRIGMFAQIKVTIENRNVLAIPETAIQNVENKHQVFLPSAKEGVFTKRVITLGNKLDGYYEIQEGLLEGEKIVLKGSFTLKAESSKESLEGE